MITKIFKKELLDTLRDRRTLITMIIIPVFIFPFIMTIFLKVSESFSKDAAEKPLKIGIVAPEKHTDFVNSFSATPKTMGNKVLVPVKDTLEMQELIRQDSLQLGIFLSPDFENQLTAKTPAGLQIFYNVTEIGMKDRAEAYMDYLSEQAKQKRYVDLKIAASELQPYALDYRNVASDKETIGKLIGGFLPYLFIIFGFIGCMYPAIDLFTGEKERGTLETLLTTPVSRWQILVGKMGVVVLSGVMAATFTLVGIFLSIEVFQLVKDPRLLEVIHQILTAKFILLLYLLLIPMITFFAGVMIPIAVNAKSFKEAQSVITPLNMVVILPAMVGFFPGVELNAITACIPVVNVVLSTKELIAGTLDIGLLCLSFGTMVLLAALAVTLSYRRFDKERNLVM
jgi:sodium transport system permease protein